MFLPRFNVTVAASPSEDVMRTSFCINGICPPKGAKMSKNFQRTIKGRNTLFALTDSISMQEGTCTAAAQMSEIISQNTERLSSAKLEQLDMIMDDFLTDANGEISSYASSNSLHDYGASFAMLSVNDGAATFSNTGNVSAFFFRSGKLTQMSENHTDKRVTVASVSSDDEQNPPVCNIKKYVGGQRCGETLHPYMSDSFEIERDDVFLICSAGLCDNLPQSRISYILSLQTPDDKIVRRLITEALARGAEDDVCAMLIRNGAKPFKSRKRTAGIVKTVASVIIVAALAVFTAALLRGCSQKPAISEENVPQQQQPLQSPAPTEFMTQEGAPQASVTENTAPVAQSLQ